MKHATALTDFILKKYSGALHGNGRHLPMLWRKAFEMNLKKRSLMIMRDAVVPITLEEV
jgi:hypothetical protein